MNFSEDTLNIINKKIHDLEQLKNKNNFITTKEPVDIEKTFRITFKIIEDLKKNGKMHPGPKAKEKYIHMDEKNECDICYNQYHEFFKCKRCVFKCCPKCFNNFHFLEEKTYCPMCKF